MYFGFPPGRLSAGNLATTYWADTCPFHLTKKEAQDVLSRCDPGGCNSYLAMEINGTQFAADPVSIPAALSRASARSVASLLLLLTRGSGGAARAGEPGTGHSCREGSGFSP